MVKLPDKVQIGPYAYAVVTDEAAVNRESNELQADLDGTTSLRQQCIYVRPDMAADQTADTVLHEVLHTICDLTGIASEYGGEKEEALVRRLSPALLDTLRRNPLLVAYLTG